MQRFSIGLEAVGDEVANMGNLDGGEFARLPQGIYKIANLVEGIDGNIKLDGVSPGSRVILCAASKKKTRSGVVSR